MFSVIDPDLFIKSKNKNKNNRKLQKRLSVVQYFGAEDLIINTAAQMHDDQRKEGEFSFAKNGFRILN